MTRGDYEYLLWIGVLEGFDVKKIYKCVDGVSISQYIAFFDRSACLHFYELLFLGLFNAI